MACDDRFDVTHVDPSKSIMKGIQNSKNHTVKLFLETDCEYYVTVDSDTIPLKNPLDLIQPDIDIIGMPTPICDGKHTVWNMFMDCEDGLFKAIILEKDKKYPDAVECHALGGGCMIIKRKVLETVKPPFMDITDEWGMRHREHDLIFCRRAREAGFHVFFAPEYRCEHIKYVALNQMTDMKIQLFKE